MLTNEQEKWIEHISDVEKIKITSYNPETVVVFSKIKKCQSYFRNSDKIENEF